MMYPPISELMKKVDCKYTLCTVIGKRARKLVDGDHPLTGCNSKNTVSIAINEFYEGKFTYDKSKAILKKKCNKDKSMKKVMYL